MDNKKRELRIKFRSDVENIAASLIDNFKLRHKKEVSNLSNVLSRWLDFRLRFVDPRPRKVLFSKAFPKLLPSNVQRLVDKFCGIVEAGVDINPYQGKGLIIHHDTSRKKRIQRTDLLWADWRILHFHLSNKSIPKREYFSERSDWILFGMIYYDSFLCIDVRHHKEQNLFSDPELIKIVARSWPEVIEKHELKNVHALETELSGEEYANLRKGGVACPITIDGKVYIGPGMGVTTASTASIVTSAEIDIYRYVDALSDVICDPESQILPGWRVSLNSPAVNDLTLCITPGGLAIYGENQKMAWVLPKESDEPNFLSSLHCLLAPEWVVKRVFEGKQSQ